jgi:hypothetical protein
MKKLLWLIDAQLGELPGTEFKLAIYAYRCLGRRRTGEVRMTIRELAAAAGISWRKAQAALKVLADKKLLAVESRPGCTTKLRLPPTQPLPAPIIPPTVPGWRRRRRRRGCSGDPTEAGLEGK